MELKFHCCISEFKIGSVSIVPLWNWNMLTLPSALKALTVSIVPLWNWNFCSSQRIDVQPVSVSIVPLWNWNSVAIESPGESLRFQSYLYGIEMPIMNILMLTLSDCFNRTFMELKLLRGRRIDSRQEVSIVPLWNWNRLLLLPTLLV